MSRPRFVPTEEQRRLVRAMSAYGVPQEDIATVVGLRSTKTLRKHFREEVTRGAIDAKTRIRQTLYTMATSGKHLAATIFAAKTRCGMRTRKDLPVKFKLGPATTAAEVAAAMDAVLQDVARGRLTPSDGQMIAALLELRRKVIETEEHEARLRALESRRGEGRQAKDL